MLSNTLSSTPTQAEIRAALRTIWRFAAAVEPPPPKPKPARDYLTLDELASKLHRSRRTFLRWLLLPGFAEHLGAVKDPGHSWRFPLDAPERAVTFFSPVSRREVAS